MAIRLLDDNALTEQLRPGLSAVAGRLAALLPDIPATSPVLVSGDWGSGKTSLLQTVRARVDGLVLEEADRFTVWFDAWHHEGEEGLLPALMRRVWESAPAAYRRSEIGMGLFARVSRFAIAVGARALPLAARAMGLGGIEELIKDLTARKIADESAAIPFRSEEPAPDAVEELRRSFAKLVADAWRGRAPIVFIDDLDRCSPDGAVALLDAIRMLIGGAQGTSCRFVVALDRGVVVEAISAKFEKIRGYDGNRYLEKLFPLEFHVPHPAPHEADALLKELLVEDDDRVRLSLTQALSQPPFANPRLMKRCINRLRLALYFEQDQRPPTWFADAGGGAQYDYVLASWIAATERWPALRTLLRHNDELGWKNLISEFWDSRMSVPLRPEALALREQPGLKEWIKRTDIGGSRYADFRAADERLRLSGL